MSKLVNWGHWLVAGFFAVSGAPFLWSVIASLPSGYREHPREGTYIFFWGMIMSLPPFACAWGIFKWRRWGRMLGIVFSVLILAGFAILAFDRKVSAGESVFAFIYCGTLVWLLLPVVRAEYFRRNQIA
jgi:hypothetical protein